MCFVEQPALQSIPHRVKFHFAHDSLQSKQQAVIRIIRVVYAVFVSQECFEQPTQFKQMMPVLRRTSQAAHFKACNDADMVHRHFSQQPLKPRTMLRAFPTPPLILINHQYALRRPAQCLRMLDQGVLTLAGLAMM